MHPRRTVLATGLALALSTALPALAGDFTYDKLFFIQRSKNANEVHYDAQVNKDGNLDPHDPVVGYWWNKAEDGSKKPISLIQKIAYGWSVDTPSGQPWIMHLKAFPERPLVLVKANGKWRAQVTIAGKQAYMNKLYVATDESGIMPKVLYVDVFGEEVNGGAPVQEHLVKN
jgi:hypothetical protein